MWSMRFPKSFAKFLKLSHYLSLKSNNETNGVKEWHFCPEIESFQRASSLRGPHSLCRYV